MRRHNPEPLLRQARKAASLLILITLFTLLSLFWPVVLASLVLMVQISLCTFDLIASRFSSAKQALSPERPTFRNAPIIFSVHVPTHNEPPELVIRTLSALQSQTSAPLHEVVVVDNNTSNPRLWRPVQAWCRDHPNFTFHHEEGVKGAKAGALNIALDNSRADATHIVTVDADYEVDGHFLACAARELSASRADFIQFPQAYRHSEVVGTGIATELADYFDRFARASSRAGAVLLTGTLSVISKKALIAAGGWPTCSSTEDAELGLRLNQLERRGIYVEKPVGRGLLPLSLNGLSRQRHRWAAGNTRTLVMWLRDWVLGRASAPRRGLIGGSLIAAQLTAWVNFALPAVFVLILGTAHQLYGQASAGEITTALAVATLLLVGLTAVLPLLLASRSRSAHMTTAICTRISLIPTSAVATIAGLCPGKQSFLVTPKSVSDICRKRQPSLTSPSTLAAILGAAMAVCGMVLGARLSAVGGALLVIPWLTSFVPARALRRYAGHVNAQEA